MYHLSELETARRWAINTITVVNNNRGFRQSAKRIEALYDGRQGNGEQLYAFQPVDFARVAEAMGCVGMRVERPEELRPALHEALSAPAPVVIDVIGDPEAEAAPAWVPET